MNELLIIDEIQFVKVSKGTKLSCDIKRTQSTSQSLSCQKMESIWDKWNMDRRKNEKKKKRKNEPDLQLVEQALLHQGLFVRPAEDPELFQVLGHRVWRGTGVVAQPGFQGKRTVRITIKIDD